MTAQSTVSLNFTASCAGLIADTAYTDKISRVNNQRQIEHIAVNTVTNAEHYIVTIDGSAYDYTSDGSATDAEIVAGLIALINADAACLMTARAGYSTDDFIITKDATNTVVQMAEDYGASTVTVSAKLTKVTRQHQAGAIAFGRGVVVDPYASVADVNACLPFRSASVAAGYFLGVAAQDSSKQRVPGYREDGTYADMDSMTVLRQGRIWVIGEDTGIVEGQQVYCRYIPSTGKYQGNFRSDSDSSTCAAAPGCYAVTVPATTNGLFLLQVG